MADLTGILVSGRYRIDSLIGSGGMANVYRAYDIKENMIIALKVLKEEHREDQEFVRRFEREAEAVLMLSHENIVRSYDVGEDGDISYIVLEYVEGSTLKDMIRRGGPIPQKTAVAILCQVLDALSHAHERGIIHRDVKPQNVMITPRGRVKLMDFGIARDTASTTRTFAGANVIGSVHYISPEQARGDNVTASSDIYSCSIMLYEMLTGSVPFSGDNSVAIALKHLREEITPPIELNPKISRALNDVVVLGASKDVATRYLTARQMKADLLRAMREPYGHFARIHEGGAAKRRRYSGVFNISLMLVIILGLFATMFFMARAIRDESLSDAGEYVIPTLIGRTYEEAEELARLRGFTVEIDDYESSAEYPENTVIFQDPIVGSVANEGDTIRVVVSSGSEYVTVPDLVGKTLTDAMIAMEDMPLVLGAPEYVASDLPTGQIIRQEPAANLQTFEGDVVDIWISGLPGQTVDMPAVTAMSIGEALDLLFEAGFTHVWVRTITPNKPTTDGAVIKQSPTDGIRVSASGLVELWIYKAKQGNYKADIAINLESAANERKLVVTAKQKNGSELVVYEASITAGMQYSISFSAYMDASGDYECHVYLDGVDTRSMSVNFKP